MAEERMGHDLTLRGRQKLMLTGVTEVVSFEENGAVLNTELGTLLIQGRDLQLKNLSAEAGQLAVEGTVSALAYEEPRPRGGWLRRLLG